MPELQPHEPYRPLTWPDIIWELQDLISDQAQPVYIVGGAVRDALLQRPLNDIDLVVAEDAIALARRVANSLKGDFFVLDKSRDVGRALIDSPEGAFSIDVARFRGEGLLADLQDRDFTINAMAVDLRGDITRLIDPLGGEADCRNRVLRRCHERSISDDPVRGLRAVRLSVQLELRIEPATLADLRAAVPLVHQVSPERIRDEFIKIAALRKARQALRVAEALGLLDEILPEIQTLRAVATQSGVYPDSWQESLAVVEQMRQIILAISPQRSDHTAASFGVGMLVMQLDRFRPQLQAHLAQQWPNDRPHSALLTLAALLYRIAPEQLHQRAEALRLSNGERDRVVTMLRSREMPLEVEPDSPLAIHRFWRQTGETGIDVCLLAAAHFLGLAGSALDQDQWLLLIERLLILLHAYYARYEELIEPPALLDGRALMAALKIDAGPIIGRLLDQIREAQVTGEVRTLEDALALARAGLSHYE